MHVRVPRLHSPVLPWSGPSTPATHGVVAIISSNRPSQSSSRLLQTSTWPPTVPIAPWHSTTCVAMLQGTVPATRSPTSVPHFAPPPGSPSSVRPLQSLSLPSHCSGDGGLLHTT